jgi:tetratricopeptide (TPR) repeat protein
LRSFFGGGVFKNLISILKQLWFGKGLFILENLDEMLNALLMTHNPAEIEAIIRRLVEISHTDLNRVVDDTVNRIRINSFDGSKWSTLAFSILENLTWPEKAGEILKALVDSDENNGAYLNNYGVFLETKRRVGQAIEWYARAYATDYKAHGHELAATFPAWTNLHRLASSIRS